MENMKYPELKLLLERKFEGWRKSNNKDKLPNVRQLAKEIGRKTGIPITHSSLHDWRQGRSKPHPEKAKALAVFFAPEDMTDQANLEREIRGATADSEVLIDPLDRVATGGRPLTVGVVQFPGFCQLDQNNNPVGFLDTLVKYFLSFSSLEGKEPAEFQAIAIDRVENLLCKSGDVDLVVGLFVDPGRSRNLWFYADLPILIPLNGVRAKELPRGLTSDRLVQMMTVPNNRESLADKIYPIVDPAELGGIYVRQFLGFRPGDCDEVEYDLDTYVKAMARLSGLRTPGAPLPISVIDEVSCCHVQKKLRLTKEKLASQLPNLKVEEIDLLVKPSSQRFFPRYRYGLAIARKHSRWPVFFKENFELFLESNARLVADLYDKLRSDLSGVLPSAESEGRINEWLSLSKHDHPRDRRISDTWETILHLLEGPVLDGKKKRLEGETDSRKARRLRGESKSRTPK